ncbi:MAG: virulence RhuM family protein [Bacteroidetes bacterium]|nr:virulence RhuM family protein [Bacteroidota bacterium]
MNSNGEIVLYHSKADLHIEVRIENETVWLTQNQMAELFDATKQNISLHINNVFKEKELTIASTVKEYLTVQTEGKRKVSRKVMYYNLDVIISVGYRVKSNRGTAFRIWANKILKDYLLKGYAISHRVEKIEKKIVEHEQKFDLLINSNLPGQEGIFFDGQIFDAWQFVSRLIKSARNNILLIDNYVDEVTLSLLSKRKKNVNAIIYTAKLTSQLKYDLEKHQAQYENIEIKIFSKSHDRFLIIDEKELYHIGASLKDLGKRWFAFSKINMDVQPIIERLK